jgi:acyl-CoA reductase-like NAD-dependent aldehyde dehydrogenase
MIEREKATGVVSSSGLRDIPGPFIGGAWREGRGGAGESRDPTTGETVACYREASGEDVAAAVEAARSACSEWAGCSALERADALSRVAARIEAQLESLALDIVDEVGKPLVEAREEARRAAAIVRYHAGAALDPHGETIPSPNGDAFVFTQRQPLGVVGLITPWNFPLTIPVWKFAPALAYGNTVVMKPAPHATKLAARIVDLLSDLPPGVFNVVPGGIETGRALSQSALDGLSFTGSTPSGRAVARMAVESGTRYQAELGGKNAAIVLADADLGAAASTVAGAAMGFAGQKCTATSRVVVEQSVSADFRALLIDAIDRLVVGAPRNEDTDVGPLIEASAVTRVSGFVTRAAASGARVVRGGDRLQGLSEAFFEPTLVDGVAPEDELAQTEVFGPVLALLDARDATQALQIANATAYGLAAAIFTTDLQRGLELAQRVDAGIVRVNGPTPGVIFNAPFGPAKASGIGLPEQGKAAREFFTGQRSVAITL